MTNLHQGPFQVGKNGGDAQRWDTREFSTEQHSAFQRRVQESAEPEDRYDTATAWANRASRGGNRTCPGR